MKRLILVLLSALMGGSFIAISAQEPIVMGIDGITMKDGKISYTNHLFNISGDEWDGDELKIENVAVNTEMIRLNKGEDQFNIYLQMPKEFPKELKINNSLTEAEKSAGILTPEVMWKMSRLGSAVISPDGKHVAYTLTRYSMEENTGVTSLVVRPFDGGDPIYISRNDANYTDPTWSPDGRFIYLMCDISGDNQLYSLEITKSARNLNVMSDIPGGIEGYGISPRGDKAFYVKPVRVGKFESPDVYTDLPKSKALIYDDLMERHWNRWDRGDYSHIFIADFDGKWMSAGVDIMEGELWDAPLAPYFDYHEIAWDNAGGRLAYTCKKLTGTEYAVSTDSDIYIYDLSNGTTVNITEGMVGYDKYPVFSPDDSKLAFQSQERPGNEADKVRLFVHDLKTGEKTYVTRNFDHNAGNVIWEDNNTILFHTEYIGTQQICRTDLAGNVKVLTSGDHDINAFSVGGGKAVCQIATMSMAAELFSVDLKSGELKKMSDINGEIYRNITLGQVQKRWVETTDGKQMLTWVVLPPNFDPNKKYPALLYCEGGPQSPLTQFWSFRWNFQLMAAQGYVVVCPNRRGTLSHGQEWVDQISKDYSGQNIRDLLAGIDDVSREPWVDETRMGCVGASYGGYSAFFLMGNHEKRFKAFIAHCGIFDFISMYGSTEELFFVNNDYGGPYWSNDPVTQRSYANSPHMFVEKWDSPLLIITGLNDFRIPYTQSLEGFSAARLRGLPSRLVAFENEAHQVFKPQNSLAWNREFFGWLEKYVK